ncbi:MAG: hypothetical protein EBT15_08685 [Betaproteobacteria bacterium]|nr:hypothetical protein [Betaproteobacteria bacterium]
MDNLSIAMAQGLLKLAETLVKTRDELRETIDKLEYQRKVVDTCANTLIDTLKDALLIAYQNAGEQDSSEVEQPMVGRSGTQEGGAGTDGDDERRDAV